MSEAEIENPGSTFTDDSNKINELEHGVKVDEEDDGSCSKDTITRIGIAKEKMLDLNKGIDKQLKQIRLKH